MKPIVQKLNAELSSEELLKIIAESMQTIEKYYVSINSKLDGLKTFYSPPAPTTKTSQNPKLAAGPKKSAYGDLNPPGLWLESKFDQVDYYCKFGDAPRNVQDACLDNAIVNGVRYWSNQKRTYCNNVKDDGKRRRY